jgi:Ca-activated chloride channel homolog
VVVVLDKSGSMGMTVNGGHEKMELADEGACEAIKLLDGRDLGLLGACDTQTRWVDNINKVIPITPGNKERMMKAIRSVRAGGGGIYCETALADSYQIINDPSVHTMSKHVIMFADAQDSEQQDNCVAMAKSNYEKFDVTTSVIGMGVEGDPDVPFQKEVAEAGHGRWFIAEDVNNLPRLFVKDAFMVSRQAFIEDVNGIPLTPYASPLLQGFIEQGKATLPSIYGYVGTTLKPRATLALHGKQADDPVLAHWVIGLGKCVAYMSDSTSRWGKDWVGWNGYSKFWTQIVRWTARSTQTNGLSTTTLIDGMDGRVVVDAVDGSGKPINNLQLQANVIGPDNNGGGGGGKDIALEQIAPGRYQGHFTASQRGTYMVAVAEGTPEAHQLVATGGGVLSYPPEYRDLQPNLALLGNVAEASDGKVLKDLDGVFAEKPNPVRTFWPLWQVLLLVVTGALVGDIAWRRLNVADWFRPRSVGKAVASKADASVGALKSVKAGRREVETQRTSMRERVESRVAEQRSQGSAVPPPLPGKGAFPVEAGGAQNEKKVEAPAGENYASRLLSAKKRAKEQIREHEERDKA